MKQQMCILLKLSRKQESVQLPLPCLLPLQLFFRSLYDWPLPQLNPEVTEAKQTVTQEQAQPSEVPGDKIPEGTKPVGLASFLDDVIITKSEKATKTKLDQPKHEMEVYMNSDMLNLKCDPLMWWKKISFSLWLGKETSMCCCYKRVFSTASDILSAQRAAMDADKFDNTIFLKKNML